MRIIIVFLIYIQFTFITNRRDCLGYYNRYDYANYANYAYYEGSGDGDNCHGVKCNTSNDNKNNNILSGVKVGAKIISGIGGTVRFTKNGKISPKYYKSGWLGGSKAKIKTYKIGKFVNIANKGLGYFSRIYNIGSSFVNDGPECGIKSLIKESISFGGSTLGSLAIPVVGGIIGEYLGDIIGGNIIK